MPFGFLLIPIHSWHPLSPPHRLSLTCVHRRAARGSSALHGLADTAVVGLGLVYLARVRSDAARDASSADEEKFRLPGAQQLKEKALVQIAERKERLLRAGVAGQDGGRGKGGDDRVCAGDMDAPTSNTRKRPREEAGAMPVCLEFVCVSDEAASADMGCFIACRARSRTSSLMPRRF
jgi:hypothetical protein